MLTAITYCQDKNTQDELILVSYTKSIHWLWLGQAYSYFFIVQKGLNIEGRDKEGASGLD